MGLFGYLCGCYNEWKDNFRGGLDFYLKGINKARYQGSFNDLNVLGEKSSVSEGFIRFFEDFWLSARSRISI